MTREDLPADGESRLEPLADGEPRLEPLPDGEPRLEPLPDGEPRLEPLLLDPSRLSIMATLAAAEWAEFSFVRDTAGLSDSTLSKRIAQLGDAGFVEVRKGYVGKRPRTWLNLSGAGRAALRSHIAMLRKIAEQTG